MQYMYESQSGIYFSGVSASLTLFAACRSFSAFGAEIAHIFLTRRCLLPRPSPPLHMTQSGEVADWVHLGRSPFVIDSAWGRPAGPVLMSCIWEAGRLSVTALGEGFRWIICFLFSRARSV